MNYCQGLTGAGVTALVKNCPLLEEIHLKGTAVDEAAVIAIGENLRGNIQHVELQGCDPNEITDEAISGLALHACNLTRLNVIGNYL